MKINTILIFLIATIMFAGCYPYYEEDIVGPGSLNKIPKNGTFELSADGVIPEFWTQNITGDPQFYYFSLDSANFQEGTTSLKITFYEAQANPDPVQGASGGLYQKISTSDLDPGKIYRLQYWYKTEIGNFQIRILKNGSFNTPVLDQNCGPTNTWLFSEIPFMIDADTDFIEVWISTKTAQANNGLVEGWIDDIKILK